jgi:hypothetical protein
MVERTAGRTQRNKTIGLNAVLSWFVPSTAHSAFPGKGYLHKFADGRDFGEPLDSQATACTSGISTRCWLRNQT